MKKIYLLSILVALAATALPQNFRSIPIASPLPLNGERLKDVSGKEISLKEEMKDMGLLVMFSCNTCPVVIRNQQRTREICDYALQNRIGVVLLNSNEGSREDGDSYPAMKAYATAQHYRWTYALDKGSRLADAFGASRTPEVFLFDQKGGLVYKGAIDDNPQNASSVRRMHLKEAIDELVHGKPVSVKETRSVGCGIKRPG